MLQLFSDLKSTPTVCASGGWACTRACALTSLPNILESSSMLRCGRRRRQNNNSALAAHFFWPFFCHHWTTTTWKHLISRFMEDVNKRRRNSPFSFWSRMRFLRIDLQKRVLSHLIKVTASWNEREFAFKQNVFRRHRLRGILNSLVRAVCEPIDRVHSMKNISTVLEKRSHSEEDYCLVY